MAKKIRGRNEGSIHQRSNGTWRVQIYIDGKRVGKTFRLKAEAQAWLRKMQHQFDLGFDIQAGGISLSEYLSDWLENSRSALQSTTIYQYRNVINKHIVPFIGEIALKDLTLARVERLYGQLLENNCGVRTVRITHSILHCALEKAVKYNMVVRNVAHGAALPKYQHAEMKVLDETQVTQFLAASSGSHYEALFYLAAQTGMRQGELFGLKWTDIQWYSGVLQVQRQVKRPPGEAWKFADPKTQAGRRTIQLGERTLQVLREHRERQNVMKAASGASWQEHGLIFPNSVGSPGDSSNLRKEFYRVLELGGLPKIRFHDLRHTAATLMLNYGVSPIVVSKILGHSKPSVTMDIYGHLLFGMQAEAAKLMDRLLAPIPVGEVLDLKPNREKQNSHSVR